MIVNNVPTMWDLKWFGIADMVATWSKHPKIKVGCVIVDRDNIQLSGGYNGLPRKIDDMRIREQTAERSSTSITVHAEANAIASAARKRGGLGGASIYVTRPVCHQCAALLIQAGIVRVMVRNIPDVFDGDWGASHRVADELLQEAQIVYLGW